MKRLVGPLLIKQNECTWAIWIEGQKYISQLIWRSLSKLQVNWETLTCIIYMFSNFFLFHLYSNLVYSLLYLIGTALEMLPKIVPEIEPSLLNGTVTWKQTRRVIHETVLFQKLLAFSEYRKHARHYNPLLIWNHSRSIEHFRPNFHCLVHTLFVILTALDYKPHWKKG